MCQLCLRAQWHNWHNWPGLQQVSLLIRVGLAIGSPHPDLLDVNESTWAFGTVESLGCDEKSHVTALEKLGGKTVVETAVE